MGHGSLTVESQYASWKDSAHGVSTKYSAVSSLAKSAVAVKQMHEKMDIKSTDEGASKQEKEDAMKGVQENLEQSLPTFLQAFWDMTVLDIESTLKHVCEKILKDESVPWQICLRR